MSQLNSLNAEVTTLHFLVGEKPPVFIIDEVNELRTLS